MSIEYSTYLTNPATADRHHKHKFFDVPRALRAAWDLTEKMREGVGTQYRLHGPWSTTIEVWELHSGYHAHLQHPDRRVAKIEWKSDATEITVYAADLIDDKAREYLAEFNVPIRVHEKARFGPEEGRWPEETS